MARPHKEGLDYFPIDVNMLDDIKLRKIKRACNTNTEAVLLHLLCNIYSDKGYYILWDEEVCFLISDKVGIKEAAVQEVVNKALQVGFFHSEMFAKHNILTSAGIQKRYLNVAKRRVSEKVIADSYSVIVNRNSKSENNNPISDDDKYTKNSIVKYSKVNKSIISIEIQRDILFIFYFKNFYRPLTEIEKFANHYEATGWKNSSNVKISNIVAIAKKWKQTDVPVIAKTGLPKKLTTDYVIRAWKDFYLSAKDVLKPEEADHLLLVVPSIDENNTLHIAFPDKEVHDIMSTFWDKIGKKLSTAFGRKILIAKDSGAQL